MFEIGTSLREARLRRVIEIADAEHGTKIRGKYLRALEDERFELLPSHTYIKGFLRSYAEYLGLDGQLYVDEYNSRYVTGEDDAPMRAPRRVPAARARRSDRRESNIVLLALTAIGVVTALVIVAWRFGGAEKEPVRGLNQPTQPAAVVQAPQAAGTARLELRATKGDSYMVVRSGSVVGNVLYQGTLEHRQTQRFDGKVLWLQLESPQNVVVKLNGNRVQLRPAVKAQGVFVTAKKIFSADPT
ncbi:MAG: helix-turn-helix domain-containing protein [Actinomycetota bacterium]|nr:helix-turn-helix domain-containing protein [Actinomycetota bacterium]